MNSKKEIFISGGLNASNVKTCVKLLNPDWVDASSALEKTPGIKDKDKLEDFLKAAKA